MNNFIFIPVGSYEQHGPHLPPDTDYLIAEKIVRKISPLFKGKIIEGIRIGISPEHEGFKETKSISKEEFQLTIDKILKEYNENNKFFFVNAHGGNVTTLNAIQQLNKEKMLVLNTFSIIKEELLNIRTSEIGGICHAGEFETSIMLYLFPEKVKMNNLKKSEVQYVPFLDPNYENEKIEKWSTINLSNSGILGDPFHATSKKGEIWFNSLIQNIKSQISAFI